MMHLVEFLCGAACFSIFLLGIAAVMWLFDLIDFRTLRRLLRQRRFGLLTMFGLMAVVAVDLAIVRGMGIDPADPGAICVALFVSGFAVAIVGFVWLVVSEFTQGHVEHKTFRKSLPPPDEIPPALDIHDDSNDD